MFLPTGNTRELLFTSSLIEDVCSPSSFKGSVSHDFQPLLISLFETIWDPDKKAKVFSNSFVILPRFSNFLKRLRVVHPTVELRNNMSQKNSAECIPPRSQAPRCASYRKPNYSKKFYYVINGVCHEIFDLHCFSWLEPIWAPDKQDKVFSN